MDSGLRRTESILSAERVILSEKWNAKARSLNAKGKDWKAEDWKDGTEKTGRGEGGKIGRDKLCLSSILPFFHSILWFGSWQR